MQYVGVICVINNKYRKIFDKYSINLSSYQLLTGMDNSVHAIHMFIVMSNYYRNKKNMSVAISMFIWLFKNVCYCINGQIISITTHLCEGYLRANVESSL